MPFGITPVTLEAQLDGGGSVRLIDLGQAAEYASCRIEGRDSPRRGLFRSLARTVWGGDSTLQVAECSGSLASASTPSPTWRLPPSFISGPQRRRSCRRSSYEPRLRQSTVRDQTDAPELVYRHGQIFRHSWTEDWKRKPCGSGVTSEGPAGDVRSDSAGVPLSCPGDRILRKIASMLPRHRQGSFADSSRSV